MALQEKKYHRLLKVNHHLKKTHNNRFEDTQLECTFLKYKICTGYIRPTVLGVYMLVLDISLDISCHFLGDECKLDSFCAPFGRGDGKCTFLETIILVEYIC